VPQAYNQQVPTFTTDCRLCPRLAAFLDEVKRRHPDYFAKPVPSFGAAKARLLVVGLAPGMHGANATGRPFTGDHAGVLLYETLHATGFASAAESVSTDDGLELLDCRITNAVRCLPPDNKPIGAEVNTCNPFLADELSSMPANAVVLALGGIAHKAIIKALGLRQADFRFGHGAEHTLNNSLTLLSSYHCSRYNTQTRRLTDSMFLEVFQRARELLNSRKD